MTTPVTLFETNPSSGVSFIDNDLVFRMTQHTEMPKENRFGLVHTKLPNRLQAVRKKHRLTQDEIAESLKTTKTRVTLKERGLETFNNFYLEAFARAVGEEPMLLIAPDDAVELLEAWFKCTRDDRAHFLKNIKLSAQGTPPEEPETPPAPMMGKSRFAKHLDRGRRGAR